MHYVEAGLYLDRVTSNLLVLGDENCTVKLEKLMLTLHACGFAVHPTPPTPPRPALYNTDKITSLGMWMVEE